MSSTFSETLKFNVGERLRLVRGMQRLKEFAEEFGETPSKISNYESGKHFPPVQLMILLVEKRLVNLNWLLTGRGEMFLTKLDDVAHISPTLLGLKQLSDDFVAKVAEAAKEYGDKTKHLEEKSKSKKKT